MEKLLKEYLFIFLSLIIFLGIGFIILIFGLRGETESLEQIYFFLFIVLILVLVVLVSGIIFLFTVVLGGFPGFKPKNRLNYLDFTPEEAAKLTDQEKEKLLKRLRDKRDETQQMIEITKKKFYERDLDQESFRELIRDYEKNLIKLESKIDKINKIMKKK